MGIFDKLLRTGEGKKVKALQAWSPTSTPSKPEISRSSPTPSCEAKTAEFKQRLDNGEDIDDLLLEAFAVVREAAKRAIGQRHYDVQLMGGAALHFGWVAEMKTGEGKTLVSTLPVYLNALDRQGRAPRHGQRLPGHPRLRVDGAGPPVPRSRASVWCCPATATSTTSAPVRVRHHLRHEQRVRLRLPPRQHGA